MFNIFKRFLAEDIYFYSLLLVLISVVSFGLGRMSMEEYTNSQKSTVILSKQPIEALEREEVSTDPASAQMQLVGSKNGSKYHALWCPGAAQIKEVNKVFFSSEADAQAKGYTQAGNCEM